MYSQPFVCTCPPIALAVFVDGEYEVVRHETAVAFAVMMGNFGLMGTVEAAVMGGYEDFAGGTAVRDVVRTV